MAQDIVPELLQKIQDDFQKAVSADENIRKFLKKIRDGTATMDETSLFARNLGDILVEILKKDITQDVLPDGRMYYNIAERTIKPVLMKNYELTNEAAKVVQKAIDQENGIGLNAMSGTFPDERVETLVSAISEEGIEWEEVERRMDEPVRNISQSFLDDFIAMNAKFRYREGMDVVIVRKLQGGACAWCRNLAGAYGYEDVPADVYRRHDNCRCTVTYKSGKYRENVWTKKNWTADDKELEKRRNLRLGLTRRTREQARQKEKELKERK